MLLSRHTRRREFISLLGGAAAAWPLAVRAQQRDRMRRLGVLMGSPNDAVGQANATALVQGLGALGWQEGRNLHIALRWFGGIDLVLFERYVAEVFAFGPEVLVTGTAQMAAVRRRTNTIPIVFTNVTDPIGQGFVERLAHPGGNITGFSNYDPPMAGKWLTMLTQITPPVSRVAVLYNPATAPFAGLLLRAIEEAAPSLKVTVRAAPVNDDAEIEALMVGLAREERGGLLVLPNLFTTVHRDAIVTLATRHRLAAVYAFRYFTAIGGLMSYGIDQPDLYRRAAGYVDRILKGAKPGDLPVQRPTKFELSINLKTAAALGITIAPSLLATADEVIE
jgi:putative tryptophan/tyrosine transport system substrate-binding protein